MIRSGLRFCLIVAPLLAALASLPHSVGDDQGTPKTDAAAVGAVLDIVYFAETRPILIRLHVEVDGRAFDDSWDDYIAALFKFLDRDGDGLLSAAEVARAPTAAQLLQTMRGNLFAQPDIVQNPNADVTAKPDFETNEDGKVTI